MVMLQLLACQCLCLAPSGPEMDLAAESGRVESIFAGPFSGAVEDAPGDDRDGVRFDPCAIAGQPFEVALDVAPAECHACKEASYALSGTLTIGEDDPIPLSGAVEVWSGEDGPAVFQVFLEAPATFPHETLEVADVAGERLEDAEVERFDWARRTSPDDAALTVWESCSLPAQ